MTRLSPAEFDTLGPVEEPADMTDREVAGRRREAVAGSVMRRDRRPARHEAKSHEPTNRSLAKKADWATAATEARRQRAAGKMELTERRQQRWQERAWSPQIEISRTRKV